MTSFVAYLERHFELRRSGDFVYFECPFCDRPWKMWANVVEQRPWCWCFRCETWADPVKLVMRHQGVDRVRARELLAGGGRQSLAEQFDERPRRRRPQASGRDGCLPEAYVEVLPERLGLAAAALRYLRSRGVSDSSIRAHRMGVCESGRYAGYIILPVTRDGVPVYFQCRALRRPGAPKYYNPTKDELGVGKSEVLFNYDRARAGGVEWAVVEGIFDAIAVGDHAVSPLGKELSDVQLAMIVDARPPSVAVCFDDDALDKTLETVDKLRAAGVPARAMRPVAHDPSDSAGVLMPRSSTFKDWLVAKIGD